MSWGMKGTTVSAPRPFPSFGHGTAPATLRSPVYLTQGALLFCKNAKMARGAAWGWVNPVGWWLIGGLFHTNQYIVGNFTIHEPLPNQRVQSDKTRFWTVISWIGKVGFCQWNKGGSPARMGKRRGIRSVVNKAHRLEPSNGNYIDICPTCMENSLLHEYFLMINGPLQIKTPRNIVK